ncbi:hypothetical protein [Citricoccus sp.]|uniref:hypothetical protein n=1 Tax=Citricoccus sp. TaxID=1978372 RepID=UPI0028BE88CD|nr:hypothetical protein [Citricoccus sp.]
MKHGTRSWKQVTAGVLALLSEMDPYRLDPGTLDGAPKNEYAPEADAIARHLLSHRAINFEQVDAIWQDWFGESLSQVTGTGAAENLVVRLNQLVQGSTSAGADAMTGGESHG